MHVGRKKLKDGGTEEESRGEEEKKGCATEIGLENGDRTRG